MFQGSKNVPDDAHISLLEKLGATNVNGTTSFDRTNYFETVPSNHLETALWLESDSMGSLLDTLTQEKLNTQREVVKNERRRSNEAAPSSGTSTWARPRPWWRSTSAPCPAAPSPRSPRWRR